MRSVLDFKILDNSLESLLIFLAVIFIAIVFNRLLATLIGRLIFSLFRRYARENYINVFQSLLLQPIQVLNLTVIIILGLKSLNFPDSWRGILIFGYPLLELEARGLWLLFILTLTWVLLRIIEFISFIFKQRAFHTESKMDDQLVPFVRDALKIFVFINAALIILGFVFHLDITSLVAGVGLGGLAIAFAAQESIKDLFGAITILIDKPFTVGDVVTVGNVTGTVEKVGIRSTRIRSRDRTLITMPNKKMMDTNVDNITLRTLRRVNLTIGLGYETEPDALKNIVSSLRSFFNQPEIFPDENYVVFEEFGESSLNIRIEYFTPFLPWLDFLRKKEEVNFKIMEIVGANKARFAYPVRDIRIDPAIFNAR
jgi:MscS family membrane protein